MGVLRQHPWRVVVVLSLMCVACLAPPPGERSHPSPFDHSKHLEDERLQCRNCHLLDQEGRGPTLPGPQLCRVCHEKEDVGKPPERQIEAFFDADARFRRSRDVAIPGELKFSHAGHTNGMDCIDCHGDMRKRDDLPPRVLSKDRCMDCHAERSVSRDCSVCHETIGTTTRPKSHSLDWIRGHGTVARADCAQSADRCELCHDQAASCDRCHRTKPPRDHTHHFRNRGHGLLASVDRSRCSTCHDTNSCAACHTTTKPRSHRAGFGGQQSRHCGSCHVPLSGTGCFVCHKGTPSHATAKPLPNNHNPAMNCRQCHGAGVALPHPDNGDSCTSCHR